MFAEINIRNMATVNRVMCACGGIYYCQSRTFANALKRRAIRVLTLKDAELLHRKKRLKGKKNTDEVDGQIPKGRGRTETDDRPSNRDKGMAGELSSNAPVNTSYEKVFPGDKRFGPVISDAKSLAGRHSKRIILLEGKRLVNEAVQTQQDLKSVFFTHMELLEGLPVEQLTAKGVKLYKVKSNHMKVWSDTVTPQGIIAICKLPKTSEERSCDVKLLPITAIFDNIHDPGMLGTLLRSAVAARCSKILVTRGCVDAWEPKVLRSGAGAHFHAPSLVTGLGWELATNYVSTNGQVFLVAQQPTSVNLQEIPENGNPVQEQRTHVDASAEFCPSRKTTVGIPHISLDAVDCTNTDITIVVSELPSSDATRFVLQHNGHQLFLPINRSISLLNAAVRGSITLFELARQMRKKLGI